MAKDNAIRDQKVFVRLGAVLEIQKMYSEIQATVSKDKGTPTGVHPSDRATKIAFERVIKELELPIALGPASF